MLGFGVNLHVQGLSSVDVSFVFAQKCTLITSLSEFISVFKQPTLSVVFRVLYECYDDFRVLYECYDDSLARQRQRIKIKITIPMFASESI